MSIRYFAGLAIALIISGCAQNTPYRTERDSQPDRNGVIQEPAGKILHAKELADSQECREDSEKYHGDRCVHFVEFDEFGNAESRSQFRSGIDAAKSVAANNGVVVVFIHGWHHNAKPGDTDISNFHRLVEEVQQDKQAVGIYVGWRGDSIKSRNIVGAIPSYAGTFWDRKETAHNIGNGGGVTELLRDLSDIRHQHEHSRLVVIGHSFGGAILYSAMSDGIAEQIRRDSQQSDQYTPIADLVVLINPAFEAMRLRPLYTFARNFEYPANQRPRLMIITSRADKATRFVFPLGRHLGTLFQSYPDGTNKQQDVTTIGHYTPYVTHQLKGAPGCDSLPSAQTFSLVANGRPKDMCIENTVLLTRCDDTQSAEQNCQDVAPGHFITRGPAPKHIPHNFPIYNIRTTNDVIPNHVKIWEPAMKQVLFTLLREVVDSPEGIPVVSDTGENVGFAPSSPE